VGKEIQQDILKLLSSEHNFGKVIEFGCGTGFFTQAIANNADHVTATDLSEQMLDKTKKKLKNFKNISIQKADCENCNFPSSKFDTVFMANVIHFINNPDKALLESYRILKKGGLIILVDYTSYHMKWKDKMGVGMRFVSKCGIPPRHFQTHITPDELRSLTENAGFKIIKIKLIGDKAKALYLKGRKI
jgi:ABC-2 type transport system ATP-binding protein